MKTTYLLAFALSSLSAVAAPTKVLKIKPAESELLWTGKKVTGAHNGAIKIKDGSLKLSADKVVGGTINIDMSTISVADITDPKTNEKLLGHLKSDDFFSVDKNKTAKFEIKKVEPIANAPAGKANATVSGDLTIKGTTKPLSFPAVLEVTKDSVKATGTAEVDRTLYGVKYGSGKFFENLGDKAIDDKFKIDLKVTAAK